MSIDLYAHPISQPSRTAHWLALLLNIPITYKNTNVFKGETKTESFLSINPNHKIPVINDNNFIVYESHAIARYFCNKYKNFDFYPENIQQRSKVDTYLDYHHNHVRPPISTYIVTRANNPKQDHSKLEASARKAIQNLENIWLKDGPFIGGLSKPSIADISAYGEVIELIITVPGYSNVNDHPFIAPFEKVKAWTKRMKQLEHYEEVHKYLYTLAARQRSKL